MKVLKCSALRLFEFCFFSPGTICNNMAKASGESLEYQVGNCDLSLRKKSSLYLFDVSTAAFTHKAASGNDEQFQNCLFSKFPIHPNTS